MSARRARLIQRLRLLPDLWNLLLLALRALLPVLMLGMIALLAWALLSRQPWPFSIKAESEQASLVLAPDVETNWRIDGAVLCVRSGAAPLPLPTMEEDSPCPGRRWQAYDLGSLREVTLRLPAAPARPTEKNTGQPLKLEGAGVQLQVGGDGSLSVQIVSGKGSAATPVLLLADFEAPLPLGPELILHFSPPPPGAPHGRLLLPFSGSGRIGRDVSWSEPTLLRGGEVSLYTRSSEAAGGRDLVATAELLPGDRVDLAQDPSPDGSIAKGFIHFDLMRDPEEPPVMRVVAFGEADGIRIVRFGDQGYSFSPGLLARVSRHSAVATWAVLIFSLLGLLGLYQGCATLGEGALPERWRAFRERWRAFGGS